VIAFLKFLANCIAILGIFSLSRFPIFSTSIVTSRRNTYLFYPFIILIELVMKLMKRYTQLKVLPRQIKIIGITPYHLIVDPQCHADKQVWLLSLLNSSIIQSSRYSSIRSFSVLPFFQFEVRLKFKDWSIISWLIHSHSTLTYLD
jgi:hypothetical protein